MASMDAMTDCVLTNLASVPVSFQSRVDEWVCLSFVILFLSLSLSMLILTLVILQPWK